MRSVNEVPTCSEPSESITSGMKLGPTGLFSRMGPAILIITGLFLALYSCAASGPSAPEKVQLAFKWEKGKTYRYRMTMDMDQQVATPMGQMKITSEKIITVSQKVVDLDPAGTATLEVKYDSIKIESVNPMSGKIALDSANPDDMEKVKQNPQLAPDFLLLNQAITFKMNQAGKVSELKGFSEMMEKVCADLGEEGAASAAMLKNIFSNESQEKLLQKGYPQLPAQPIGLGQVWEVSEDYSMSGLMIMNARIKNTYAGNELLNSRNCARIDSTYEMTISMDSKGMFAGMFDINWDAVDCAGTIHFDTRNNVMVRQSTILNMKGSLKPKSGSAAKEDGSMPASEQVGMVIKMTVTNELLD